MPQMATVLTEFADNGDARTFSLPGHTAQKQKLFRQKRTLPANAQANARAEAAVVLGTVDSTGLALSNKVNLSVACSLPVNGDAADVDAAIGYLRDFVASDDFESLVKSQQWAKGATS